MIDSRLLFRFFVVVAPMCAAPAHAEDGYRLWLRYEPLPAPVAAREHHYVASARAYGSDPSVVVAGRELKLAISGLLHGTDNSANRKVILGTATDMKDAGSVQFDTS